MFKVNCACGKSNKNFKYDIGPMFVDECCKAAGYDDLGKRKSSGDSKLVPAAFEAAPELLAKNPALVEVDPSGVKATLKIEEYQLKGAPTIGMVPTQPLVPSQQTELSKVDQPSVMDRALAMVGLNQGKLSKNKLSRLRVEELRTLAKSRNLPVTDDMTRIPLTELLLKS